MKLSNTGIYTDESSEDHSRQRTPLLERIFFSMFDYSIKASSRACWFRIRSFLDGADKAALTKDDVQVILTRLERAREAIQQMCPILLSRPHRKQPKYTEPENIRVSCIYSLRSGKVTEKLPEGSTETDQNSLVQKPSHCWRRS